MLSTNKQKGFSNLELVVAIAIIVILASISFIALNDQRSKARDAKRISDVRRIRTALELYFSDTDEYPVMAEPIILGKDKAIKLCSPTEGGFVGADVACTQETTYMSLIPTDPLGGQSYKYQGDANAFNLTFTTEKESDLGPAGVYVADSGNIRLK